MAQKLKIDIVAKDRSKQALGKLQGSLAKVKCFYRIRCWSCYKKYC